VAAPLTYQLLSEEPDRIECWVKKLNPRVEPGITRVMSLSSVNGEYLEKAITSKWTPVMTLLAVEKAEGRGWVSFEHVPRERTEIGLAYFGNVLISKMVRVVDVVAAQKNNPIIMHSTVQDELEDWYPLDDTYREEESINGYETNQLENDNLQLVMREEIEKMLDDNGFIFSEDGKSFQVWCAHCQDVPCVWDANKVQMVAFDEVTHDEDTEPNKRRHALYRQMALIINGGPARRGNRLKLPECVVLGIRE
jgi:hypothetical protein